MSRTILGIDGSWYASRIMAMVSDVKQVPKATLSTICRDMMLVGASEVICAFDGADNFRYEVYADYKSARTGKQLATASKGSISREERQIIMEAVRKYLANAGLIIVSQNRYEADDVLRSLGHQANCRVVLGANDKDLIQTLVDKHVRMWTLKGGYLNPKNLKVPPERMLVYQTLRGDDVDSIPKLVTEAPAVRTANAFATINDYAHSSDEAMEWCMKYREELIRNHKLVKLVCDLDIPLEAPITFQSGQHYPRSYCDLREALKLSHNPNRLFNR